MPYPAAIPLAGKVTLVHSEITVLGLEDDRLVLGAIAPSCASDARVEVVNERGGDLEVLLKTTYSPVGDGCSASEHPVTASLSLPNDIASVVNQATGEEIMSMSS